MAFYGKPPAVTEYENIMEERERKSQEDKWDIDPFEFDYEMNPLSQEAARRQAQAMLKPIFQQQKEDTLGNLSQKQLQSGFYGQAPGDYAQQSVLANLTNQYMGNLSQQAQDIKQQDFQRQLQQKNLAFNTARQEYESDLQQALLDWEREKYRRQEEEQEGNQISETASTLFKILPYFFL